MPEGFASFIRTPAALLGGPAFSS